MKIIVKNTFQEKRIKSGLSMEMLSKKAGISIRTVFRAEHGTSIYPVVAGKLCTALKCEFDDIFEIQ